MRPSHYVACAAHLGITLIGRAVSLFEYRSAPCSAFIRTIAGPIRSLDDLARKDFDLNVKCLCGKYERTIPIAKVRSAFRAAGGLKNGGPRTSAGAAPVR
jgi:hypothetical protein